MSLQVWLPLNGNLDNYGLSNAPVTNNGATVNDYGKIGKCYQLGQNKKITSVIDIQGTPISASFWIYLESFQGTYDYILSLNDSGGYADQCIAIVLESATKIVFCVGGNSSCFYNSSETLVGKWAHLAVTFDGSKIKGYLNGVEICSLNSTTSLKRSNLTLGCRNGNATYYTNCKLNDLRIYDHCLSAKEVKEISKGLVLHYGFDDIVNMNIISSRKSYSPTSYLAYQFNLSENFVAGQTYTFQLWDVNVAHSGKTEAQLGISIFWGGGYVSLKTMNGTSWFTNGHADYIKFSITITSSQASGSGTTNSWINIYNSVPSASGTLDMSIGKIKIEKGNVATLYTNFNEAHTIMYDKSGYKYDGIITGELITNTNSTRYNNCAFISNGLTEYIKTPTINIAGDAITVSMWINSTNTTPTGDYHMPFQSNTNNYVEFSITKSGLFRCGLYVNGTRYVTNISNVNVLDGNWHMLSVTYDGANIKRYIDGILKSTTAISGTLSCTSQLYWIGRRSTTTYAALDMYFSDIRMYTTALSEEEIKELYDTAAYIDNIGNISCYEFEEQNENLLKYEYTIIGTNTSNTSTRGKYTVRNDVPAMAFKATDTYWNSEYRHVMLAGRFTENTQYVFDLWLDTDSVISSGNNVEGGFTIYYTDNTTSGASLRCKGSQTEPKGWQHKLYISTAGKTVSDIIVYYYTSATFYVRADSFITPLYDTKINKNGVIDTSQFIENTDVAFIGTGDVNSNKFLEI